jgi:hypothetical protein
MVDTPVLNYARREHRSWERWRPSKIILIIESIFVPIDFLFVPQVFSWECCHTPLWGFYGIDVILGLSVLYIWLRIYENRDGASRTLSALFSIASTWAIVCVVAQIFVCKSDPGFPQP